MNPVDIRLTTPQAAVLRVVWKYRYQRLDAFRIARERYWPIKVGDRQCSGTLQALLNLYQRGLIVPDGQMSPATSRTTWELTDLGKSVGDLCWKRRP